VRYYLGSAHYRSVLDYHDGVLVEAEAAVGRIATFLERASRRLADTKFATGMPAKLFDALPADFVAAMDDDLAIPAALAVLHEQVRSGNAALDGEDLAAAAASVQSVLAMTEVLGINPTSWAQNGANQNDGALEALMQSLIAERNAARAAKDFARSDAIRDQLQAAGIVLEDGADGTHWSVS
jgi:cysteinyl-tRNA synthetase